MCDNDRFVQDNKEIKDKVKHFEDNVLFNPQNKGKMLYIFFKAEWCPACKSFKPEFFKYREVCKMKNKDDMLMVVVDVDSAEDLSQEFKVEGLPTLYAYKIDDELINNKDKKLELYKEKIVGSDKDKLKEIMNKYNGL